MNAMTAFAKKRMNTRRWRPILAVGALCFAGLPCSIGSTSAGVAAASAAGDDAAALAAATESGDSPREVQREEEIDLFMARGFLPPANGTSEDWLEWLATSADPDAVTGGPATSSTLESGAVEGLEERFYIGDEYDSGDEDDDLSTSAGSSSSSRSSLGSSEANTSSSCNGTDPPSSSSGSSSSGVSQSGNDHRAAESVAESSPGDDAGYGPFGRFGRRQAYRRLTTLDSDGSSGKTTLAEIVPVPSDDEDDELSTSEGSAAVSVMKSSLHDDASGKYGPVPRLPRSGRRPGPGDLPPGVSTSEGSAAGSVPAQAGSAAESVAKSSPGHDADYGPVRVAYRRETTVDFLRS